MGAESSVRNVQIVKRTATVSPCILVCCNNYFPGYNIAKSTLVQILLKTTKNCLRKEINEEDFSVPIVVVLFVFFRDQNEKNLPEAKKIPCTRKG